MPEVITISINAKLRRKIDKVCNGNRSRFFRDAVVEKLKKMEEELTK
ncbi:hypothetical protein [Candidatus Borrarchaeum sp.]|nr:hypothetical protein [Candidatus Borrarchaeum sp.]